MGKGMDSDIQFQIYLFVDLEVDVSLSRQLRVGPVNRLLGEK